ncbi:SRPBCC family protein [Halorubrum vacuolatum]|uniref:Ligand-binding SRPBCC domain-containing protein n=1 Tax=Halorubrum vacuolatum TaxID=63740 RepID=A0A238VEN1_HALVU|nr:SRPBCC family protein [Halorubrum vacuolatum]SNR32855.1 Ligand-binding SRPBCC domain-containing protein [Halorubrum vacuolatum]
MATYRRETRVPAPIEKVWEFHATIDGLRALTPAWMNLRIDAIEGPDGAPAPDELRKGSRIRMSMRPFGIGPRQRWESRIIEREPDGGPVEGSAYFVDDMVGGPFRRWVHTHSFYADGGETRLVDTVEYRLPFGPFGDATAPFAKVGFEGMFRDRHRRTRERFSH